MLPALKMFRRDNKAGLKNYLFQSFLATISLFIILSILSLEHAVVIASIGASAFIVFVMPSSKTARPQNVIGGHLIGYSCGFLSSLFPHTNHLLTITLYAVAVGLSIFFMILTNTEHPPASGTALGAAITGYRFEALFTIITSMVLLSLFRHLLKKHLVDLL